MITEKSYLRALDMLKSDGRCNFVFGDCDKCVVNQQNGVMITDTGCGVSNNSNHRNKRIGFVKEFIKRYEEEHHIKRTRILEEHSNEQ